ncbi:FAD/NAD(P)-binding domain-containing protein [Arthrobacter sp. Y-9]|uniref:FAD/NAD(P)-binding protein n=1 Tax=Arthrobacter sp. Y-9 TaxID=3039385 RepID=UPI00241F3560|nr:FAD/NAD(P)-binding domain-containing protein [Arthrobacter sp. Y-9]WFR85176.1 FAD/NAD(P)-binding protein [Arthrobacter sp. Y-9]
MTAFLPSAGPATTGAAWCDVLFVGAGPKALMALAELDTRLAGLGPDRPPLRITLCDPAPPGPGAVWDPEQPAHLRMNVDAGIVDLRCPSVPESYREWERRSYPGTAGETFPPRAQVGRYLEWTAERLASSPRLELRHCAGRVTEVERDGDSWRASVATADGPVFWRSPIVALCTGHADAGGADHRLITRGDGADRTGPLTVTGAALTAIDVVLDVTEGRGGAWLRTPEGELEYTASGAEPRLISLASRSGEMMLPKPATDQRRVLDAVLTVTSAVPTGGEPDDAWWRTFADAASAAARTEGIELGSDELMRHLDQGTPRASAAVQWAQGLARAHGVLDGDPAWWWGRAWSAGYRDVVRSLERSTRDPALWERWRRRAARLEKWAFGPPPATVSKLQALHQAGLLTGGTTGRSDASATVGTALRAVTAGPGVLTRPADALDPAPAHDDLWASLLARGHVTVRVGERGVFTRPDGVCLAPSGQPSPGLAALGRPTEDPVIGHDTLNRTLHQDGERWSRAVAEWVAGARSPIAALPFPDHERNSR